MLGSWGGLFSMSDIFVSYKAEDRRRVQPLVDALQQDGLGVWWDAHIGGGDAWRETIETQLDSAKCVLVIWSKRSVGPDGRFVRDEASRAQRRNVYVPVLIDKTQPPLGFGETQAISLVGWKGDRSDQRYRAVLECAKAIIAGKSARIQSGGSKQGPLLPRRSLLVGGAAAAVAAAFAGWSFFKSTDARASEGIAVLPFANISGDPSQAYFSDGIAEELRSALARIPHLKVIGRTSSELVKNSDAVTAAHRLGVGNLVTGSVRRSASLIRVTAQLVSGSDGVERWSQVYDRAPGDILMIQSDIAKSVADALSLQLSPETRRAMAYGGTDSPAAHDLYLKAIDLRERGHNEGNFRQALTLFDAAIEVDPRFADAYAQKASTIVNIVGSYSTKAAQFDRGYNEAMAVARQAIALAPESALAHAALAAAFTGKLDVITALSEYQRALKLFRGEFEVLETYSNFAARLGNSKEALKAADKAIVLDPLNPRPRAMRGNSLFYARNYEEAAKTYRETIELARAASPLGPVSLGNCLLLLGKTEEARAAYAKAPPDNIYRLTGDAILSARTGDAARASRNLAQVQEIFGDSAAYQQAEIYAQLGQADRAFAALERSLEVRDPGLLALPRDPFLDPLRSDGRFPALLKKLGWPQFDG